MIGKNMFSKTVCISSKHFDEIKIGMGKDLFSLPVHVRSKVEIIPCVWQNRLEKFAANWALDGYSRHVMIKIAGLRQIVFTELVWRRVCVY